VRHYTSSDFWDAYSELPTEIRELADKNYELLKANPRHPSLQLKLKRIEELWSVRVGQHYRAVGIDALGNPVDLDRQPCGLR
jgi:hypothetical protein